MLTTKIKTIISYFNEIPFIIIFGNVGIVQLPSFNEF